MRQVLKDRVDNMTGIHREIKSKYWWSINEISARYSAFIFAMEQRPFQMRRYQSTIELIKKNTGIFSNYRSSMLHPLAALLNTKFEDPGQALQSLLGYDRIMKKNGFKPSPYLPIAAYALMATSTSERTEEQITKAMQIYKMMKQEHFWLTSSDDYAISVLLAAEERDIAEMMEEMEDIYKELNAQGFSKSNGLQFLSQLLTFGVDPVDEKIQRCIKTYEYLKSQGQKVHSMYYASIGFLTLISDDCEGAASEVIEMMDYIKSSKSFRSFYRELNLLIASSLVSSDYAQQPEKEQSLVKTGIGITLQALISSADCGSSSGGLCHFSSVIILILLINQMMSRIKKEGKEMSERNIKIKNIILIGMPGSGKSTVGVLLAKALGLNFIDTDLIIQKKTGKLLQNIIDNEGIDSFIRIEEKVLQKINVVGHVIATGGSAIYSDIAMNHLKINGLLIYLNVSYKEIERRINNIKTRGIAMIKGGSLWDLYIERTQLYEMYADITIDCDGNDVEDIVRIAIKKFKH